MVEEGGDAAAPGEAEAVEEEGGVAAGRKKVAREKWEEAAFIGTQEECKERMYHEGPFKWVQGSTSTTNSKVSDGAMLPIQIGWDF